MKKSILVLFILVSSIVYGQDFYEKGNITGDTITLEGVSVTGSYTAVKQTPFTFKNVKGNEIKLVGNEEPAMVLAKTPGMNYHSDNGTGYGYIYYRLRGIDQTRINSTLNGVPMNEPEDQGIYYNNYPGFLQAVSSIQIIRGAGLSKNGVSSYGGSINFESLKYNKNDISASLMFNMATHGTRGVNATVKGTNFYVSGSLLHTDGYRNNSSHEGKSVFYGGKFGNFELTGFIGAQKNDMAWLGETLEAIKANPRTNSNTEDETDDFKQIHNQLKWNKDNLTITAYHTYLKGWYDTDLAHFGVSPNYGTLINRLNLESNWFGLITNYKHIVSSRLAFNYGVSAYTYSRSHNGTFSSEPDWNYDNTGYKNEISPYIKGNLKLKDLVFYGDVQYRYNRFSYDGLEKFDAKEWNFLNWSTGVSYLSGDNTFYYGMGKTHREPTRTDLFSGEDNYNPALLNPVKSERALNYEFGYKLNTTNFDLNVNLYRMNFENEIVLNGKVGPNSILLHQNAAESFRHGFELDFSYRLVESLELKGSGAFSQNKIKQDGETTDHVLSPGTIINGDIVYTNNKGWYVGLNTNYNSKSYLDLSNQHTLPEYTVYNVYAGFKHRFGTISGRLNNIGDKNILKNGLMATPDLPVYFVSSGINAAITITYNF